MRSYINAQWHSCFPKVVKGGFIIGGNYAEGYLIENGQIFDQIRWLVVTSVRILVTKLLTNYLYNGY